MSVRSGDEQMVQFLISLGADPNAHRSIGGQTALELAAYGASMPIIEALVEAGANLKGRSALVKAAGEGRTDVVVYLLDRGADINEIPDNENINDNYRANGLMNALCQAAWKGQANVVRLLLGRGADAEIKDTKGRSALELARMEGNEYCVELLQAHVN
jgi:ankyrin repeat protein